MKHSCPLSNEERIACDVLHKYHKDLDKYWEENQWFEQTGYRDTYDLITDIFDPREEVVEYAMAVAQGIMDIINEKTESK